MLATSWLATGCISTSAESGLTCSTDSGDSVNVREIYGTWKMITGYTDGNRTSTELENDYDVLVVQTGGGICRVGYVSQAPVETVMLGVYEHKVTAKKLNLQLDVPANVDVTATYSFQGSCADPRMTLRYSNGALETYQFRGKDIGDGCPF